jgi:hypothetical protein
MLWSQFSAIFANCLRKNGVFLKKQWYEEIFSNVCSVLCKKCQFFRRIIRRKYFKNHNIGPRWVCENAAENVAQPIFLSKLLHNFYLEEKQPKNLRYFSKKILKTAQSK